MPKRFRVRSWYADGGQTDEVMEADNLAAMVKWLVDNDYFHYGLVVAHHVEVEEEIVTREIKCPN